MSILIKGVKLLIVLTILMMATVAYSALIEPQLLIANKYSVSSPLALKNLRVVFFSDTHFGKYTKSEKAEKIVKIINEQNPDIVIFGGDLVDNYYRDKRLINAQVLGSQLASINAKYKLAAWGNHDYGGGAEKTVREIYKKAGFTILANDRAVLEELGVEIIIADEMYSGEYSQDELMPQTELLPILVCHQPDVADELINEKLPIMLSGHTHGGQVLLPFITDLVLPNLGQKYRKGEFDINGGKLFVSSGIGVTQLPIRFLNLPEIVVLDIKTEEAKDHG